LSICLFHMTVYNIQLRNPCAHEASVSQFKAKSHTPLLRMLPVCITVCLKSVVRYTFSILDTYHPDITFTSARMLRSVVIFRTQKGSASRKVWETMVWKVLENRKFLFLPGFEFRTVQPRNIVTIPSTILQLLLRPPCPNMAAYRA